MRRIDGAAADHDDRADVSHVLRRRRAPLGGDPDDEAPRRRALERKARPRQQAPQGLFVQIPPLERGRGLAAHQTGVEDDVLAALQRERAQRRAQRLRGDLERTGLGLGADGLSR